MADYSYELVNRDNIHLFLKTTRPNYYIAMPPFIIYAKI